MAIPRVMDGAPARLGWGRLRALLVGLAVLVTGQVHAQVVPINIVSIGDSYASGEGAPDQSGPFAQHPIWRGDNRDGMASACHRSALAAPAMAAGQVAASRPATFTHMACTGAQIPNLGTQLSNAMSQVSGPIDALVISIGGNDIGFVNVVTGCFFSPCLVPGAFPTLFTRLTTLEATIRSFGPSVRHVFLTEYPDPSTTPFPPFDDRCGTPLAPNILGFGFDTLTAPGALWAATSVIAPLNGMLANFAATADANTTVMGTGPRWHFVSGISAAFHGHGYCMGFPNVPHMWISNRYVNTQLDSQATQGDLRGTMHPNSAGHAAAGAVIAASILANVPVVMLPPPPPPPGGGNPPPHPPAPGACARKPWLPGCDAARSPAAAAAVRQARP